MGAGLGNLLQKFTQRRAEVFGITEVRAHARAQLGFVDKFVAVGAVLERCLRTEQQ